MDLLGRGANDIPTLENIFREICEIDGGGDGLEFAKDSIKGAEIRADKTYQGIRLTMRAVLDGARIPLQIDIGFGDAVTPKAVTETLDTILGFAEASSENLSERNSCGGEVRGDGEARNNEQPDERFLGRAVSD